MKILILSWNTATIPLSGFLTKDEALEYEGSYRGSAGKLAKGAVTGTYSYLTGTLSSLTSSIMKTEKKEIKIDEETPIYDPEDVDSTGHLTPNFINKIFEIINENNPDVVVVGFQEDASPFSSFHSTALINGMKKDGRYDLFHRDKMMGLGVSSVKKGTLRGLRTSYYIRKEIIGQFHLRDQKTYSNTTFQSKGYVLTKIETTVDQRRIVLTFINTHFPFDARSIKDERSTKYSQARKRELINANEFFINLHMATEQDFNEGDSVFIFGDLNYRISAKNEQEEYLPATEVSEMLEHGGNYEDTIRYLRSQDELLQSMKERPMSFYSEGPDNQGPHFPPTCKMAKRRNQENCLHARSKECWKTGKFNQRVPSWCDRIIYRGEAECQKYDSFDSGIMKYSDHSGVYGVYIV